MGVKKTVVSYTYTPSDFKAYQWCVNNGIYISPFCKENFAWWYIDIEINNKKNRSPYVYVKDQIWQEIWKFYKYYYEKYEK